MKTIRRHLIPWLFCTVAASVPAFAETDKPAFEDLSGGWTKIETAGVCSTGSPYHFLARRGISDKLMIYFNGGGACWDGQRCDPARQPNLHLPSADLPANDPANFGGMFELGRTENPFSDYSMIFLPYCTGDMHIGGGSRTYDVEGRDGAMETLRVQHAGAANAAEVLNWVYDRFDAPSTVFVTGHSAGAVGASFYGGVIAEAYETTPVVLLGDAAGGYNSPSLSVWFEAWDTASVLPEWPEFEGKTNATLTFEDFYVASARRAPNLTVAQVNHINDQVQLKFTTPLGERATDVSIPLRILNHYTEIEDGVDVFHSFTASGDEHEILPAHEFYTTTVEGVPFYEWIGALSAGKDVGDITCIDQPQRCD